MSAQYKVELKDVRMQYLSPEGETEALRDVSFGIAPGEFVSIVGPSGCGKSTILSLIAGLIKPTSGIITIDGEEVRQTSPKIGYMLQQDYLYEWRTILQNALLGIEIRGKVSVQDRQRVMAMLHDYGLGDFAHHYPRQLSGGMRQRVALIRTLAINPDILLLDEPFSALDYQTRLALQEEVATILRKEGKTTILVTHDLAEAIAMSDRILVISKRPGSVKADHQINLSCEQKTPFNARKAPEFRAYFSLIWEELDVHV